MQQINKQVLGDKLSELLTGATIKSFEWATYYTVYFLLRRSDDLPAELELTCCSDWFFSSPGNCRYNIDFNIEELSPLDSFDCLRGFILAGLTTTTVRDLNVTDSGLAVRFSSGVEMNIPLKNQSDPEEDSFLVKTPRWTGDGKNIYIKVRGDGEIVM